MLHAKRVDATQGSIIKQILIYSAPLILSTLIQTLFNLVDIAVLGNMADEQAVASVGATASIVALIVNSFIGLASGTKINLARQIGAKDEEQIKKTVDTSLITAVLLGAVIAILGNIFAPWFLEITKCPADCMSDAVLYIRIYISAAPIILLYNYGSAILTTSGDTQRPLYYILASGALNVVLNIILCLILPQKVAAVAIATAASQLLGATLVILRLRRADGPVKVVLSKLRMNFRAFIKIIRLGLPVSFTHALFPLGTLQIQAAVNSYGVSAIAGSSAATTIQNIVSSFSAPFGTAALTFVGQNIGARKPERVSRSFTHALWLAALIGGTVGVFFYVSGPFWLSLILGDNPSAIEFAMVRMKYVSLFYCIASINGVLSHTIQAFGYPFISTLNSIFSVLIFRIIWMAFVYPVLHTFSGLMFCFTVSWSINLLLNIIIFTVIKKRYNNGLCKEL